MVMEYTEKETKWWYENMVVPNLDKMKEESTFEHKTVMRGTTQIIMELDHNYEPIKMYRKKL